MRRDRYVSVGLIISGLSGLLLLISDSFLVLFGVVFLLGLGPGAVDRRAKRARGRALPGGDPHLRPRRGVRRLSPARAPRQRAGAAAREPARDLLGLPGRLRRALARCVLFCGIAFTIATHGPEWQPAAGRTP